MKAIKKPKKVFDKEFKMDGAKMVIDGGRTIRAVASDIGVCPGTIRAWVALYRADMPGVVAGSGNSPTTEHQLKELMEENRKLKIQVTFLKKTMAYFVEQPQ